MRKYICVLFLLITSLYITACSKTESDVQVIKEIASEPTTVIHHKVDVPVKEVSLDVSDVPNEFFSDDITFSYEYVNNDEVMPFGLFTPSTATDGESKPLILWLHGMGEFGVPEDVFNNKSLPKILKESTLDGFDAYVICPHMAYGKWYAPHWFRPWAVENVKNLIDWSIEKYNIDVSQVIISGHSSGGVGAMYIAHELPLYFDKMVILSGEGIGEKIYNIHIPAKGYVENSGRHHDYMKYIFEPVFGEENLTVYDATHSDIPELVFSEDLDGDNRADVIEWMFDK